MSNWLVTTMLFASCIIKLLSSTLSIGVLVLSSNQKGPITTDLYLPYSALSGPITGSAGDGGNSGEAFKAVSLHGFEVEFCILKYSFRNQLSLFIPNMV